MATPKTFAYRCGLLWWLRDVGVFAGVSADPGDDFAFWGCPRCLWWARRRARCWVVDDDNDDGGAGVDFCDDTDSGGCSERWGCDSRCGAGHYIEDVDVGKKLALIGHGADVVTVHVANSEDCVFRDGVRSEKFNIASQPKGKG